MRLALMLLTGALCGGVAGTLMGRWLVERERERWGVQHGL